MDRGINKFQWAQLLTLTAAHFFVDMFNGMLPALFPAIRAEFNLTLTDCVTLWATLSLTCNVMQILSGPLRAKKSAPLLLHIGLILAAAICLVGFIPKSIDVFAPMLILAVISGIGIAIAHPEGLRAIHTLNSISPAMSTAVFMTGGFMGFASGGYLAALLVDNLGLPAMAYLFLFSAAAVVMIVFLKIRLAVEPKSNAETPAPRDDDRMPFWPIWLMAVPAAISSIFLVGLLPTRLNELGFSLTFGSFSIMMFGSGGAIGSIFWAVVANKKGLLPCTIFALFCGIPLLILHTILIEYPLAVAILFAAGFCAAAAYPLMVTMARNTSGPSLGQRMGFMVGGAWGIANAAFMVMGKTVEHFGVHFFLTFLPAGFALSACIGLSIIRNRRRD